MYHTVVITCGTSFNNSSNFFCFNNFDKFKEKSLNLFDTEISEETENVINKWLHLCIRKHKQNKLEPNQVSAEYSTMYSLKKLGKLHKKPTVVLIVTNSIGGYMAERLLSYLFRQDFNANIMVTYVTFDVSNASILNRQIGEYMSKLTHALRQGEPNTTCFVPLGGYKFMTSYGYIVGSILKYPTVYVNEHAQQLIQIPWVPIDVEKFIEGNATLLRKCLNDFIEFEKLHHQEKEIVSSHPYVFEIEEGLVGLTPFGQFLLEQSDRSHIFNTQYYLSNQVRNLIKNQQDQSIFVAQQMQELVKKIKLHEHPDLELMHEKDFDKLDRSKMKYHLYKGASNGRHVFRLAYRYDSSNQRLYANYLWLNHDRYEREAAKGIGIYDDEADFRDVTEEIVGKYL